MKEKIKILFSILFAVFFISYIPIVSCNTNIDDHLDQEQTKCDEHYWATDWPGNLAQSFKPTLNVLTRVSLYGWRNESPPNDLKVSIRSTLNGEDLTYVIVNSSDIGEYSPEWFEADFPNINVTPESTYFIVWSPTYGDSGQPFFWWCDARNNPGIDPYDRGAQWLKGEEQDWADFCFMTFGYSIPTVKITTPTSGSNVYGMVSVSGTAEDKDGIIQKVEVKIDNGSWATATGTTNWFYNWNTINVDNGNHVIHARSYDGGSYSHEVITSIYVKNTVITIENVNVGLGVIYADIHNIQDEDANNVNVNILVQGGFFKMVNINESKTIPVLQSDAVYTVSTDEAIFGIGSIYISVSVEADNAETVTNELNGFIIGPLILNVRNI